MTDPISSACGLFIHEASPSKTESGDSFAESSNNSFVNRFSELTVVDQGVPNDSDSGHNPTDSFDPISSVEATHIIVLIHGWMGNPSEMDYILESIQNAAVTNNQNTNRVSHRFVIHSAACNAEKTDDGIAAGGSRIAHEINELVKHVVNGGSESRRNINRISSQKFTLSIVGNSLGGLYARHALAGIKWEIGGHDSEDPPVMLIPMVFVTTATPHLGISQHTYVPLPRAAEFVVAQGMKETGRDFFLFTEVLEHLFCQDYFLEPLSSFQQRIAYINVYGTDFQVPTATAAFWASGSDSPHYRVNHLKEVNLQDTEESSSSTVQSAANTPSVPRSIVMTLTTPRRTELSLKAIELNEEKKGEEGDLKELKEEVSKTETAKINNDKDEKVTENTFMSWSKRLDRLGWTKVLVDVREEVPGVRESIASALDGKTSVGSKIKNEDDNHGSSVEQIAEDNASINKPNETESSAEKPDSHDTEETSDWKMKDLWTADELLTEFKGGLLTASATRSKPKSLWDLKPKLPMGHAIMIANAKDAFNKKVTTGGKPVMDYLGASLIQTLHESLPYGIASDEESRNS